MQYLYARSSLLRRNTNTESKIYHYVQLSRMVPQGEKNRFLYTLAKSQNLKLKETESSEKLQQRRGKGQETMSLLNLWYRVEELNKELLVKT